MWCGLATIRYVTRRWVVGLGVAVAVLWAAAAVAWVDAWPAVAGGHQPAAVHYTPPKVEVAADVTDVDQAEVAAYVDRVVNDPRGWRTDLGQFTLRIVQPGYRGIRGINQLIGYAYRDEHLAVVTADAWLQVGPRFVPSGGTLDEQRTWVILHELGHLLGHEHVPCPGPGQVAPIMRTATYALDGCTRNVWPNP